jgi:hypothetical protein
VFVRLDLGGGERVDWEFGLRLAVASILAAVTAFTAGVVIAVAIRAYAASISRVYAWDLVGAGIGALAVVPLLRIPAPLLVALLGVVAVFAALCFAERAFAPAPTHAVALVAVVAVAVGGIVTPLLDLDPPLPDDDLIADEWTPLSRVVAYDSGPSAQYSIVLYDRIIAPVPTVTGDRLPSWEDMQLGAQSIPYELDAREGRTLVIGGGGGRDIYNALEHGERVDVIEVNAAIRDAVDDELAHRSGSPYTRPGVSTTIGDGRSVLARRDTKYDHINIGFTDTLTASAAQGYALTENNLYTMEAFDEYYDHLAPGGMLSVSRLERLVGDEAVRATVLTLAALEDRGIDDPERHVVVLRGTDLWDGKYGTVLSRLTPFTDAEVARLRALADERGNGVAYAPGGPYVGAWKTLAQEGWDEFCHGYELNVCPPTDDRPFFFNMKRPFDLGGQIAERYTVDPYDILVLTFGILVVLAIVGLVVPMFLVRGARRPPATSLVYFAAIGLGFLLLEIVLTQRFVLFLGFPTYSLSVVLFSLLLFTGVGARLSAGFVGSRRAANVVLTVVLATVLASAFFVPPLLENLIDLPFASRVAVSIAIIAPLGVMLGMPMPLGLDRLRALHESGIPYAWGVNGIASVVASVLGVLVAILFGFTAAALVAGACYAVALAHSAFGRWSPEVAGPVDLDDSGRPTPADEAAMAPVGGS